MSAATRRRGLGDLPYVIQVGLLAAAYVALAKLGLSLGSLPGNVAPVWPPSGLALAVLVLFGYRFWPGVFLGALLVNGTGPVPFGSVLGMATGNTLEALAGTYLLAKVARFHPALDRVRDVVALGLLAAGLATALGATAGVASLWLGGVVRGGALLASWRLWWVGDALGILVVAPFLFAWTAGPLVRPAVQRGLESLAVMTFLAGVAGVVLGGTPNAQYLVFPFVMLAATRFRQRGATGATIVLAAVGIWRTTQGVGPFAGTSTTGALLRLDGFMAVVALTGLVLAAIVSQRDRGQTELELANRELDSRVRERTSQLEHDRQALATAQRIAGFGSWDWDIAGDVMAWSEELASVYGLESAGQAAGLRMSYAEFLFLVHPDDVATVLDMVAAAIRTREPFEFEYRIVLDDGSVRWLAGAGEVVGDAAGTAVRLQGTAQDVTERRRADLKFKGLLESAPDAIVVVDAEGTIRLVNRQTEMLFGYDRGELVGQRLEKLLPERVGLRHPHLRAGYFAAPLVRPMGAGLELAARRRDGTEFPVDISLSPLETEEGMLVSAAIRDVTERKRLEDELQTALHRALEASQLKSQFLANMSHEIRTPMNGVLGMAHLLLDTPLDDVQRRYMLALRDSGQNLLAIINDILDFSKVEAGRIELERIDFNLRTAIESLVQPMVRRAGDKGLALRLEVDEAVPRWVCGDPVRLGQVVTNLCDNAVKFTDAGSITLTVSPAAERVRFELTDTGIGIAPQARPRLLDPFTQADASTTRRFGGTGLGLAISRQLVDLMGGTFDYTSREGEGSTFWFEVPLQPVAAPREPAVPADAPGVLPAAAGPDGRPRVLVVEDSDVNQLVARGMLEHLGYDVDLAVNGLEAVHAAASGRYEVILMDCLMPVMDGYEATGRIRALPGAARSTPIVALTASAMKDDRARCLDAGMDDYVSKPLDPAALAAALARCRAVRPRLSPIAHPAPSLASIAAPAGGPGGEPVGGEPVGDEPVLEPVLDQAMLDRLRELGEPGDITFFREIVGLFLADAPRRMTGLAEALEAGDTAEATRFAHSLKGSAANLGACRLADLCAELEAVRGAEPLDAAMLRLDAVQAEYRRVAEALTDELVLGRN